MGNKKMFITFSYASELKFLLKSLLLLFSLLTLLTLLPLSSLSTCLSSIATPSPPSTSPPSNGSNPATSSSSSSSSFIKRSFIPYGTAAYSLVLMSAYRTGPTTFSLTALSSKPLHVYSHPTYTCHWTPRNSSIPVLTSAADKILPDWGYGHVYTTVVLTCTFESSSPAVASGSGGTLRLHATSSGGDTKFNKTEVIEALVEEPTEKVFNNNNNNNDSTHYKYDYVYCGSSLYGDLSPQRIREWLAYHVNLFGEKSHFVLHDAGGVHEEVLEVIRPWMELGYVTLQDIREQERFDGYYHNQFLVVNDCLLRY